MASIQYTPFVSSWVDHTDFAAHLPSPPHTSTLAFGNAWWGRTYGGFSFPPSSALRLLLVAVHINQWGVVDNHEGALDYMRAQAPVGARDLKTLEKLLERNVPTYFSACLTLTWDPNIRLMAPGPKTDVLVIDTVAYSRATLANLVPKEIMDSYKSYSVNLGYVNNKGVHTRPSFHHPLQFAYGNLLQLAKAKLVITARIHIALPCVALGTPVIFTLIDGNTDSALPGGGGGRVDGLSELFHVAYRNATDNSWRFKPDWDWENPLPNPSPHLRQKFVASLWSKIRKEPMFADGARMFGVFPRPVSQSLDSGDNVQVVEGEAVEPILTLRTLESVLFHHPDSSVVLVRTSDTGSWGELEEEVDALQEAGYSIEVVTSIPDLQPNPQSSILNPLRIYSPTILLTRVPDEQRAIFQNYSEAEQKNENVLTISEVSDFCDKESREGFDKLTGVRMNIPFDSIKNASSNSLCRRILNENCILSNIIV